MNEDEPARQYTKDELLCKIQWLYDILRGNESDCRDECRKLQRKKDMHLLKEGQALNEFEEMELNDSETRYQCLEWAIVLMDELFENVLTTKMP